MLPVASLSTVYRLFRRLGESLGSRAGPGLMQRSRQRRSKSRDTCTSRSSRKGYFQALDGEKLLAIGAVECSLRFYTGRRLGPNDPICGNGTLEGFFVASLLHHQLRRWEPFGELIMNGRYHSKLTSRALMKDRVFQSSSWINSSWSAFDVI